MPVASSDDAHAVHTGAIHAKDRPAATDIEVVGVGADDDELVDHDVRASRSIHDDQVSTGFRFFIERIQISTRGGRMVASRGFCGLLCRQIDLANVVIAYPEQFSL